MADGLRLVGSEGEDRSTLAVACDAHGCDRDEQVTPPSEEGRTAFPPPWLPAGWKAVKLEVVDLKPAPGHVMPVSRIAASTNDGFMLRVKTIALTFCPDHAEGDPMVKWEPEKF